MELARRCALTGEGLDRPRQWLPRRVEGRRLARSLRSLVVVQSDKIEPHRCHDRNGGFDRFRRPLWSTFGVGNGSGSDRPRFGFIAGKRSVSFRCLEAVSRHLLLPARSGLWARWRAVVAHSSARPIQSRRRA